MFILEKNVLKYRKKKYSCNYIFRKFEIVVCFALLLYGVERNTFLKFDSINDSLKSKTWNSYKRMHCNEEARRIRGNGTSCSCMRERWGRKKVNVHRLLSLLASHGQAGWVRHCVGFRSVVSACRVWMCEDPHGSVVGAESVHVLRTLHCMHYFMDTKTNVESSIEKDCSFQLLLV